MINLFNGHFVEIKAFYAFQFGKIPSVSFIGELDVTKVFAHIDESYKYDVVAVYQHSYFDYNEQKMLFNNTIFVLKNNRMIELGDNYCQVLYTPQQYPWVDALIKELVVFRMVKETKEDRIIGFARQTELS